MLTRRSLLRQGLASGMVLSLPSISRAAVPETDVTFLVVNDIHACQIGDSLSPGCAAQGKTDENLLRHIRGLNGIDQHNWPQDILGKPSGFISAGQPIAAPRGVIVCGDATDDGGGQMPDLGEGTQLLQFSKRYRQGDGPDRIRYPVYVGLGNHDLDQDDRPPQIDWYRDEMRDYVRMSHKPSIFATPEVPADNYDSASNNYSWNWGGLHLVQAQRYVGDTDKGTASSLAWLKHDLATYAADGRPVVLFQHYGWDPFSLEHWDPVKSTFTPEGSGPPHWWGEEQRQALMDTLSGYNVVGIFHGHEHDTPMAYKVGAYDVFKAKAAFMGGFCLVRVTNDRMDVAIGQVAGNGDTLSFDVGFSKVLG